MGVQCFMHLFVRVILLLVLFQGCSSVSRRLAFDTPFENLGSCEVKGSEKHVVLVREWEIPAALNTRENPDPFYPQTQSQKSIFEQLVRWSRENQEFLFFGYNCSGELGSRKEELFNGWPVSELKMRSQSVEFKDILTYAPAKLSVKNSTPVICLDSLNSRENYLKAHEKMKLLVSLMSEWGVLVKDSKKVEKEKTYLLKVKAFLAQLEELSGAKSIRDFSAAEDILRGQVLLSYENLVRESQVRSEVFAERLSKTIFKEGVFVVGVTYLQSLKVALEKRQIGCTILSPQNVESEIADRNLFFKKMLGL